LPLQRLVHEGPATGCMLVGPPGSMPRELHSIGAPEVSASLISIIGPPAVGKTTLAEQLVEHLPAGLIREDYAGNPFLAASYLGRDDARLPGQLYFLISRVKQLSLINWPKEGTYISDYGFCQDRIFAAARLGADELKLYERIVRRLERLVRPPDLLIHLDACEAVLLQRIASRGREFESPMTGKFLSAMREAYNEAAREARCPVISVDCDAVDLQDRGGLAALVVQIRRKLQTRPEGF